MEKKHQVHNLIILDESGSMAAIKSAVIGGFNEIVQNIKGIEKEFPQQQHFISLISFNGLGIKLLHFIDPAAKLEQIDAQRYAPNSLTPLYDAIGVAITQLRLALKGQTDYHVLVTILTDGEENDSKEYSEKQIKSLIEELQPNGWTFTYIGTDHDIEKSAHSLAILNTLKFDKDEAGMKNMFVKENTSRWAYSNRIDKKQDVSSKFYDEPTPDN